MSRMLVKYRPAAYRTLEDMIVASSEAVRPPERLTVTQAAQKYVRIKEKNYSGPWSADKTPYLVEPQDELMSLDYTGMVFVGPARTGKALPLDTRIPTPGGWTTMGDISEGDVLFDEAGAPCRVVAATEVMYGHDCYRIKFDDGTHIDADAGHRWLVHETDTRRSAPVVLETQQMVGREIVSRSGTVPRWRYCVPVANSLQLPDVDLPVDPYLLGLWLGDGQSRGCRITAHKDDVPHYVRELKNRGFKVFAKLLKRDGNVAVISVDSNKSSILRHYCPRGHDKRIAGVNSMRRCKECGNEDYRATAHGIIRSRKISNFRRSLVETGLLCNKHIPAQYFRASIKQRLDLLCGLMDTDGCITLKGMATLSTSDDAIARGFSELLNSLGIKHSRKVGRGRYKKDGKVHFTKTNYTFCFTAYQDRCPVSLPRKLNRVIAAPTKLGIRKSRFRNIVSIHRVPSVPVRCIQVDSPSHLFLAGEQMVPTHNTQMVLNWLAYTAICDPVDMLVTHMTQATGRDWSLSDLAKLFRNSPEVRARLVPGRQNDNVHDKAFLSGMRLLIKHPSITELSGKTISRMWLTDIDRMPLNVDGEGDPFSLAKKRTQTFKRHGMTVAEASPGFPVSDAKWIPTSPHEAPPAEGILSLYNDGDRRRWHWSCPQCRGKFEPDFKLFSYPKSNDAMESAEQVVMVCPHDGFPMTPDMQFELNLGGKWIKDGQTWLEDGSVAGTARRSDIASFWLKGPAAAFTTWPEIVLKYLNAEADYERTGSEEKLKTVTNTDLGLPYTPKALEAGRLPEELKARAKHYSDKGVVPPGVAFLLTTIDVQAGGRPSFVCHTYGVAPVQREGGMWAIDIYHVDMWKIRKSRRLDEDGERKLIDPASYPEDWDVLIDEVIEKTYPLAGDPDRHMQVKLVACDSGGAAASGNESKKNLRSGPVVSVTSNAYDFWRRLKSDPEARGYHRRFHLLKGSPSKDGSTPDIVRTLPDSQQKDKYAIARGDVPVWLINSNQVKDQVSNMLGRTDPGGRVHFPQWFDSEGAPIDIDWLYTQLTTEVRDSRGWTNPSRRKNEALDLLAYAVAFLRHPDIRILQIDWSNPPGWAQVDWNVNDLVFSVADGMRFAPEASEPGPSLSDLADSLG